MQLGSMGYVPTPESIFDDVCCDDFALYRETHTRIITNTNRKKIA